MNTEPQPRKKYILKENGSFDCIFTEVFLVRNCKRKNKLYPALYKSLVEKKSSEFRQEMFHRYFFKQSQLLNIIKN